MSDNPSREKVKVSELEPVFPLDPSLQVERWPDRKRKVLSKVCGNSSTILATFVSDETASVFLEMVNDRIRIAYAMGKRSGYP